MQPPNLPLSQQIGLAGALSGVVAGYLSGDFPLDGAEAGHTVTCGLSYRGDGVCTAAFASTAVSVLLSLLILAFQCAAVSADGSAPRGATFCGPILSLIGFAWWLAFGAAATSAALSAAQWDSSLTAYRTSEGKHAVVLLVAGRCCCSCRRLSHA